ISDVQMPEIDGVELLRRLKEEESPLSVIVVTGVADVPTAVRLMEIGATTLLEKPYDQRELLHAVERAVMESERRWQKQTQARTVRERLSSLLPEERSVMDLMLKDAPSKAISAALALSGRTVDRRRQQVLDKMHVRSLTELATLMGEVGYSSENGTFA